MIELEFIARILLSIAFGALIGIEREKNHKPAGLRTHMLVCVGACLITVSVLNHFSPDSAARIIANIVTGIGFLGAGSIIASRQHVQGITTAASIWVVAGIGLVVGIGEYILSIIATVLVYMILEFVKFEKKLIG
jgi:putative Mg2+ transporter-C (MgtC) family protein